MTWAYLRLLELSDDEAVRVERALTAAGETDLAGRVRRLSASTLRQERYAYVLDEPEPDVDDEPEPKADA